MDKENEDGLVQVQHSLATARIPDAVGAGVFANEMVILKGSGEIAIDFIQGMASPRRLATRAIMNLETAAQMVKSLESAMDGCVLTMNGCTFVLSGGSGIRWMGPEDQEKKQDEVSVSQIYETTKITDDVLVGRYANMVHVSQSNGTFCLDFVTTLFPRSVVTARVFLAMYHATELLNSLKKTV